MADLRSNDDTKNWIVCAWHTPDYAHWANRLRQNLEGLSIRHDIVEVAPLPGMRWEARTRRKAQEVSSAMGRHPIDTIIFLDVDCEVRGSLDDLADTQADALVYVRAKRHSNGVVKWGGVRSGTLVLRPTFGARLLVDAWLAETDRAEFGDTDQNALTLALGRSTKTLYGHLPVEYCAVAGDKCPHPIIYHDRASADEHKLRSRNRWFWRRASAFGLGASG